MESDDIDQANHSTKEAYLSLDLVSFIGFAWFMLITLEVPLSTAGSCFCFDKPFQKNPCTASTTEL